MCLKLKVIEAAKYVAHILRKLNSKLKFEETYFCDNNFKFILIMVLFHLFWQARNDESKRTASYYSAA